LAITGYDTKENRDRIIEVGADGYLAKPVEQHKLLQHVKAVFNKKQSERLKDSKTDCDMPKTVKKELDS